MAKVLVIEDDADIVLTVSELLRRAGCGVDVASDGRSGLRAFHSGRPDLVILDVMLPEMDGWQVLDRIRDLGDVPVLVLSSHRRESDKVRGLRAGADDYLTKPFGGRELTARVHALLRRAGKSREWRDVYDDGYLQVRFDAREVRVQGRPVTLTPLEFRLLSTLIDHAGQVLSAEQLLEDVWDDPFGVGPDRVKFAVLRLRRKLGAGADGESPIQTARGFGYRYAARSDRHTGPDRRRH